MGRRADARRRKECRYPELRDSARCQFVVTAMEVGGRFSADARDFLDALARGRSSGAPRALRESACKAWLRRWTSFVAVAGVIAFAASLLREPNDFRDLDGPEMGLLLGNEAHA